MKEIFWSPYFKIMRETKTCHNYTEVGRLSARLYAMLDGISDVPVFNYADRMVKATLELQREAVKGNVGIELYKEGSIEVINFNILFKIIEKYRSRPIEDNEWDIIAQTIASMSRHEGENAANKYLTAFSLYSFELLEETDKQHRKEAIA